MARRIRVLEALLVVVGLGLCAVVAFVTADEWKQYRTLTAKLPAPVAPERDLPERPFAERFSPVGAPLIDHGTVPGAILGVAISHDEQLVACACGPAVVVEGADSRHASEARLFQMNIDEMTAVAFTNDDRFILAGGKKALYVLDAEHGRIKWMFPIPRVTKIVLSRDGRTAYVASYDKSIHVVDVGEMKQIGSHFMYSPVVALALRPDGELAAGFIDGSVALLKPTRFGFEVVSEFRPHAKVVDDLAFSPDGKLLASSGDDHTTVLSVVPDKGAAVVDAVFDSGDEAWGVAFSPDGTLLASTSRDGTLSVIVVAERWRARKMALPEPGRLTFTHDGRTLVGSSFTHFARLAVPRRGLGAAIPAPRADATGDPTPRWVDEVGYLDAMKSVIAYADAPYEESETKVAALLHAHPKSALARIAKARLTLASSPDEFTFQRAGALLDEADKLGSRGVEWWTTLAALEAERNDDVKAEEALDRAFAIAPHDPYGVLVDARIALRRGNPEVAIEVLGDLVRSTTRRELLLASWRLLAQAYANSGDIDAAEAAHRRRVELAPESAYARVDLADFLLSVNEPAKALAEAKTPFAVRDAKVALGDHALWVEHRPADALRLYDEAAAALPGPFVDYGRAAVARERGDFAGARAKLESALDYATPGQADAINRALAELPR